ncbi:MAG TPA: NAD(P)/FAD-dependent oxidoreductase [Steroidobacteraceae bacterium]|nr:NAD(P)/FAD-dependent oxidoreductase [Steroidobacteraceae bacterium]
MSKEGEITAHGKDGEATAPATAGILESTLASLDFDIEQLREKYRRERDKRIRPEGERQYVETQGKYARYEDFDPHAPTIVAREPIKSAVEILIIGSGWSGLMMGAHLKMAGFSDIRIVEKAADFGGTWYWNRYPGCQCDIESYCYLPLLEETGYIPSEKYAYAPEIFEHARRIGRHFRLYENAVFQTTVTHLKWEESQRRWLATTNRGDEIRARFVLHGPGPASHPKLPGIPGFDRFKGHTFHTSRWDYGYTGGDNRGNLTKLADKRVAIIGTGATALQCIPHLGAGAKHLYVFQRTPSTVDVRGNKPTDPDFAKTLKPGWQLERQKNFESIFFGADIEDLVNDSMTAAGKIMSAAYRESDPKRAAQLSELLDFKDMNNLRARVEREVKDPAVAELLKPWYRRFCKRPGFHDDYLATFNRPNVTLIDTSGSHGVERITENGVVANGVEYPVDCIVYSTGFEISTGWEKRIRVPIQGVGGKSLYEKWNRAAVSLHGYATHGFPNWFYVGLGQGAFSLNFTVVLEGQVRHLAYILAQARARGVTRIEVAPEAEKAWTELCKRTSGYDIELQKNCTPGYFNSEGKPGEGHSVVAEAYSLGVLSFENLLREWRERGGLQGLQMTAEPGRE